MEVREMLERGRGRIADEANWSSCGPGNDCTFCTVSSMWPDIRDTTGRMVDIEAYDAAVAALARELGFGEAAYIGSHAMRIGTWNDTSGRTHAEVLDLFSRAIGAVSKTED